MITINDTFFTAFAAALVFLFIFITGFHDEGNLIATVVTSRSLSLRFLFRTAFVSQLAGTLLLGTKVAVKTVSGIFRTELVLRDPSAVAAMLCASMLGAIVWNLITWVFRIPSSSSHALVGGLLGPFLIRFGTSCINGSGLLLNVLLPLFTSPLIGYGIGFAVYRLNCLFLTRAGTGIKGRMTALQIVTCVLINAFQGSNDAQKGMGVMALLLAASGGGVPDVPFRIVALSAAAISLGLVLGGVKMIRSVGAKIFNVRTVHSMSAQVSSAAVIVSASLLGFPISGTQIVNSSVLGVGAADRPGGVGWSYAKSMLLAWGITIPASLLLSGGFYLLLLFFLR